MLNNFLPPLAASSSCMKLGMPKLVSFMPENSPTPRAVCQLGRQKTMQKSLKFNWVTPHHVLTLSQLLKTYSPKLHPVYFHSPFSQFYDKDFFSCCMKSFDQGKKKNPKPDRHWFSCIYVHKVKAQKSWAWRTEIFYKVASFLSANKCNNREQDEQKMRAWHRWDIRNPSFQVRGSHLLLLEKLLW